MEGDGKSMSPVNRRSHCHLVRTQKCKGQARVVPKEGDRSIFGVRWTEGRWLAEGQKQLKVNEPITQR